MLSVHSRLFIQVKVAVSQRSTLAQPGRARLEELHNQASFMTTGSYLGRTAKVSFGMVANKPRVRSALKREIKASMDLAGPNLIEVHVPHSLGGLQSQWKQSNKLLHKIYQQKRAFSNVFKLAAVVATFGCRGAISECIFCSGVRTKGVSGFKTPSMKILKEMKTSFFGVIRLFSCTVWRNCSYVFLCYPTCL